MNPLPSISVVIATRDRPQLLRECLESITRQTSLPDEVIVVNDGGSAEAEQIVAGFSDALEVRYLWREHGGVGAARNLGNRHARGEWVCIQDDDDVMCTGRIAAHRAHIQGSVADVSYGAWINFTSAEGAFELNPGKTFDENAFFNAGLMLTHGAAAVRRRLAADHPYREDVAAGVDFDFFSRLIGAGARFEHCGEIVLLRRMDGDRLGVAAPHWQVSIRQEILDAWNAAQPGDPAERKARASVFPYARIRPSGRHLQQLEHAGIPRPRFLELPLNRRWARSAEVLKRVADLPLPATISDSGQSATVPVIVDLKGASDRILNAVFAIVEAANTRTVWSVRPPVRTDLGFTSSLPGDTGLTVRLACGTLADGVSALSRIDHGRWLWSLGSTGPLAPVDQPQLPPDAASAYSRLKDQLRRAGVNASAQICRAA